MVPPPVLNVPVAQATQLVSDTAVPAASSCPAGQLTTECDVQPPAPAVLLNVPSGQAAQLPSVEAVPAVSCSPAGQLVIAWGVQASASSADEKVPLAHLEQEASLSFERLSAYPCPAGQLANTAMHGWSSVMLLKVSPATHELHSAPCSSFSSPLPGGQSAT